MALLRVKMKKLFSIFIILFCFISYASGFQFISGKPSPPTGGPAWQAVSFTTGCDGGAFSETDSGSDIDITSSTITVDTMQRVAVSYVTCSESANWLTDFEYRFAMTWTAASATDSFGILFSASDVSSPTQQDLADANSGIAIQIYRSDYQIQFRDFTDDEQVNLIYTGFPSPRYIKVARSGSTCTMTVYTDSDYSVVDTSQTSGSNPANLTCGTTAWDYLGMVSSRDGSGTSTITYTVSNLEVYE